MNRHKQIYRAAKKIALNNGQQYHLVAFLKRKGHIIKVGTNTDKTHPRFKRQYLDGTWGSHMHAEMSVLRFAKPGDVLEVVRYLKSADKYAMAKPCMHCMNYIKNAGIKTVRYTNLRGEWEEIHV